MLVYNIRFFWFFLFRCFNEVFIVYIAWYIDCGTVFIIVIIIIILYNLLLSNNILANFSWFPQFIRSTDLFSNCRPSWRIYWFIVNLNVFIAAYILLLRDFSWMTNWEMTLFLPQPSDGSSSFYVYSSLHFLGILSYERRWSLPGFLNRFFFYFPGAASTQKLCGLLHSATHMNNVQFFCFDINNGRGVSSKVIIYN